MRPQIEDLHSQVQPRHPQTQYRDSQVQLRHPRVAGDVYSHDFSILVIVMVLVPSSPGLRPGPRDAETPLRYHPTPVRIFVPTVFCQKLCVYWQNEGFWRFQAEVAGSNVQHLDAKVEPAGSKVESAGSKVDPVNPKERSGDGAFGRTGNKLVAKGFRACESGVALRLPPHSIMRWQKMGLSPGRAELQFQQP